ncbi:hypothetical protein Taro_000722 [Colocasia esculenta]|uniref:Reverse transcriptase domain-containing protein n=1 Tax=Colocasia esculenta TaxID=4460 RepID=A0A843TIJ5_COLES|nr:hypothetical protein [Colocasia esculenta]
MEEVLSRGLRKQLSSGHFKPYAGPRACPPISHLLYADDTLIFTNGHATNIQKMLKFLTAYEAASGQRINNSKSQFVLSRKAPAATSASIKRITGFRSQDGSINYLGIHLHEGRVKISDFKYLFEKINGKFSSWKSKFLSQAGRTTLINSVLSSIPIYTTSAMVLPKGVIWLLEKACASFFWSGLDGVQRRHWLPWSTIQRPTAEGGLGIRSLWHVQLTMATKYLWNIYHGTSLWAWYAKLDSPPMFNLPKQVFTAAKAAIDNNTRWILENGKSPLRLLLQDPSSAPHVSVHEALCDPSHHNQDEACSLDSSSGLCLNVDGASKGNPGPSGGGGSIRNSNGDILLAFAFHYGFSNSLQAEVRALHDGLKLAEEFGFHISMTFSDSATLVTSLSTKSPPSWDCLRWWRPALAIYQRNDSHIRHTFREANQVDTRSSQVDTSPRFQKVRSTLDQVRSTLDPVSSRSVCLTGTAGRH